MKFDTVINFGVKNFQNCLNELKMRRTLFFLKNDLKTIEENGRHRTLGGNPRGKDQVMARTCSVHADIQKKVHRMDCISSQLLQEMEDGEAVEGQLGQLKNAYRLKMNCRHSIMKLEVVFQFCKDCK